MADAQRNRQTVLLKVEECLAATQLAIANSATVGETQNAMAMQIATDIDAHTAKLNELHEVFQTLKRQTTSRADIDDKSIARLDRDLVRVEAGLKGLGRELRLMSVDEARVRQLADIQQGDRFAAFVGVGFLARLKWLLFGVVPRPAAMANSENPDGEAAHAADPAFV